ncbi:MAG: response regulator transcription factor [Desulfobacterales bacterium]|jgi:CheY-like chemotaxis protein|nr:response regulator transcription factor [Desulfobacterales bacterium]MDD3082668.1 response regulator transcription factor [Desulfobacterales bacterium]MDD3951585.1 response regulator transcription factor [Desulfobacterales bacterium]MDY0377840.1 response regulator transcription factor [Desulfobacterales bacterium]
MKSGLGGLFSIESSPGAGCRATIAVPKEEPALSESIHPPFVARSVLNTLSDNRIPAFADHGIRIVIADDHPMMREGLASLLKHRDGLEVIGQAGNGRQAVFLARELNPDLILMDVSMPELDGIQATAQIIRAQPNICIVGLSMHDDETTRERMLAAGTADYLCKSNPTQNLIESIVLAATRCAKKIVREKVRDELK